MPHTADKIQFLEKTVINNPEYKEFLAVFRELYSCIRGNEEHTGITFVGPELNNEKARERIQQGFPFLVGDHLQINSKKAKEFIDSIIEVLMRVSKEGVDDLEKISQLLQEDAFDLRALFKHILDRNDEELYRAAKDLGVTPDLLNFILDIPLKTALELVAEKVGSDDVAGWKEGYCPICGFVPGMSELVGIEGKRFLSCSCCFFKWSFNRLKCPFCGNKEHESLSYFEADDHPARVDICKKCNCYIKTRDSRKGHASVPLEAEDLATIHLDLLAGKEGFERKK